MTLSRRDALAGALGLYSTGLFTQPARSASLSPTANGCSRRWRIGYAETMAYSNYSATLAALIEGLARLGWIRDLRGLPYVSGQTDSGSLWAWLASRTSEPYLEFVADAYVTGLDQGSADPLLDRLHATRDIDLMIVMGTVAGLKVATATHDVPTLVFSATNPVSAGIVASATDTGSDHIWAHLDPQRFQRQLTVFHRTFHFERLGIAFDDSPVGRAIASLSDIEAAATQLGFTLVRQTVPAPQGVEDQDRYEQALMAAWETLSTTADAIYITYGRWPLDRFATLIRPLLAHHIPSFSQLGPEEVERGALMSIARADMVGIGQFGANTIARVLHGEALRHLPQVYFDTPSIAWNLSTAQAIGYRLPFTALVAADALYGVPQS